MEEITKVWNVVTMSCSDELLFQMLNAATIPNVKTERMPELSRILSGKQKDRSQLRVLANLLIQSVPYRTANVTAYLEERGFKLTGNVYKRGRTVLNTYKEIAEFINAC